MMWDGDDIVWVRGYSNSGRKWVRVENSIKSFDGNTTKHAFGGVTCHTSRVDKRNSGTPNPRGVA